MSQHKRHEASVYIGPAALCPEPDHDRPYLLITGDQDDWVQPLIQERVKRTPDNRLLKVRHNTIGKPGTTKSWHAFNHPSLNGIHDEETIRWCNPAWDIDYLGCKEIENKKLQDILSESKIIENNFHLVIAQGDPHLTLKRSAKLLKDCQSIDLSLHPLALVWRNSINEFLTGHGFKQGLKGDLIWQKGENADPLKALTNPSESENFIHPTVQYILGSTNLERYRAAGMSGSDLFLLQQITLGRVGDHPEESSKGLIFTKTKNYIKHLLNTKSPINRNKEQKKGKQDSAINLVQPNQQKASAISDDKKAAEI